MPQQMIVEYHLGIRLGTVEITVQRDAYVFSIHEVASRIVLSATVNIDDIQQMNKEEKRIYWIAKTGDTLPSVQFAGWSKRYIGSVVTLAGEGPYHVSYHVWEMRESSAAPDIATRPWDTPYPAPDPRSEMMAPERLDEIADQLAAADPDQGTIGRIERVWVDCTREELSWLFANINDVQELARARKIRARLLLSMPK